MPPKSLGSSKKRYAILMLETSRKYYERNAPRVGARLVEFARPPHTYVLIK